MRVGRLMKNLHGEQALWIDGRSEPLQLLPIGPGLGQQLVPIIQRMTMFQPLVEHPVPIVIREKASHKRCGFCGHKKLTKLRFLTRLSFL